MKVKIKKVYYCDFCKKRSLRSLAQHEKHCTGNPDRECRLCDNKSIKPIIEKYKKLFTVEKMGTEWPVLRVTFKKKFTLKNIIDELDYRCPNCILAIIRALGLNRWYMKGKIEYFDYKKELEEWWEATNKEAWEADQREY